MPTNDRRRASPLADARQLNELPVAPTPVVRRAGQTAKPIVMTLDLVRKALPTSLVVAGGLDPARTPNAVPPILWDDGTNRLLVDLNDAHIALGKGTVDLTIGVSCDQVGRDTVVCTFVTSGMDRPAGFVWATESRPRGPAAVVEIWGEALVALCWRALVEIARTGAASQGVDAVGQPLLASTVVASPDGLFIVPMAAHPFMRVAGGPS